MGRWIAWLLFGRPLEDAATAPREPRERPRGFLLYVLAASLTVAGVAAIVAITEGSLGVDDLRVLATSLGFAIFSATAAAGSAARREGSSTGAAIVGVATAVLSAISLITLIETVWSFDEISARTFGTAALLTLAGSHASIVLRAQRRDDSQAIRFLSAASIFLASADCLAGALIVQGTVEVHDYSEYAKAAGAVVIAMLLTTALQPILRAAAKAKVLPPGPGAHVSLAAIPPPPPPPPAATVTTHSPFERKPPLGARLTPAIACALAAVIGLAGYLFGHSSTEVRHVVDYTYQPPPPAPVAPVGYQPPPPPQPPPDPRIPPKLPAVLEVGQVRALPPSIRPHELFRCPKLGERRVEFRRSARRLGLDRIEMRRGPRGLCIRVRGVAVANMHNRHHGDGVISFAIFPAGSPGRRDRAYRVIFSSLPDGTGRYWVRFQRPGMPTPPATGVEVPTLGNLGMSDRQASILVQEPRLPRWVLDPHSTWEPSVI